MRPAALRPSASHRFAGSSPCAVACGAFRWARDDLIRLSLGSRSASMPVLQSTHETRRCRQTPRTNRIHSAPPWFVGQPNPGFRIHPTPPGNLKKRLPKEILEKRSEELRSRQRESTVKSLEPSRSRRPAGHPFFPRFGFQHLNVSQKPLFPRNPLFPAHPL